MDTAKLNKWAAEFIGEAEDTSEDSVDVEWYTSQLGAAVLVLVEAASRGKNISLEIEGDEAEVSCGDYEEEGSVEDLAKLIVTACYKCHNANA